MLSQLWSWEIEFHFFSLSIFFTLVVEEICLPDKLAGGLHKLFASLPPAARQLGMYYLGLVMHVLLVLVSLLTDLLGLTGQVSKASE